MKRTNFGKKGVSALIALGMICMASPIPASASELTAKELIEKYADYAYAEVCANIPIGAYYVLSSSEASENIRQAEVIVPLHDGTNNVTYDTLSAQMEKREAVYNISTESDYRLVARSAPQSYQFYRNSSYESGFYYIIMENGCASIVGCDTEDFMQSGTTVLQIPERIGGAVVTRIESRAFSLLGECLPGLTDIIMPNTVETVGIGAFQNVNGGTTADLDSTIRIQLSDHLKAIQTLAFWGAEQSVSDEWGVIELPDSLEFLGYQVFDSYYRSGVWGYNWKYLIRLPDTPVYIDQSSFQTVSDDFMRILPAYGQTLADAVAAYHDPLLYFGQETLDRIADDPETWQNTLDVYERNGKIFSAFDGSDKYNTENQPQIVKYLYNWNGAFLYDQCDIVSIDHSVQSAKSTPLYLPNTAKMQETEQAVVTGDIDCSGSVNIADAVLLARFIAEDKETSVTAVGIVAADLDGDGSVTAADLADLLERIASVSE